MLIILLIVTLIIIVVTMIIIKIMIILMIAIMIAITQTSSDFVKNNGFREVRGGEAFSASVFF